MKSPQFLLALVLSPVAVMSHGCPAFTITNTTMDSPLHDFLPPFVDEFIQASITARDASTENNNNNGPFIGVHDCHVERRGYEVGLTAICSSPDVCECRAYFQFQECASCTLCPQYMNGTNIGIDAFSADCSNVKDDLFPTCQASCGFLTQGCFPVSEIEAGPTSTATRSFMMGGMLPALVVATVTLTIGATLDLMLL